MFIWRLVSQPLLVGLRWVKVLIGQSGERYQLLAGNGLKLPPTFVFPFTTCWPSHPALIPLIDLNLNHRQVVASKSSVPQQTETTTWSSGAPLAQIVIQFKIPDLDWPKSSIDVAPCWGWGRESSQPPIPCSLKSATALLCFAAQMSPVNFNQGIGLGKNTQQA